MLNQPCIPRINPAWLCYRIFYAVFETFANIFKEVHIYVHDFNHLDTSHLFPCNIYLVSVLG